LYEGHPVQPWWAVNKALETCHPAGEHVARSEFGSSSRQARTRAEMARFGVVQSRFRLEWVGVSMTLIVVDGRLTRSHLARRHYSARRGYQRDHRGSSRLYCMLPSNGASLSSVTDCV